MNDIRPALSCDGEYTNRGRNVVRCIYNTERCTILLHLQMQQQGAPVVVLLDGGSDRHETLQLTIPITINPILNTTHTSCP